LLKEQIRNNTQNITRLTTAIDLAVKNVESAKRRYEVIIQEAAATAKILEDKRNAFKLATEAQQEIENNYNKKSVDYRLYRMNALRLIVSKPNILRVSTV
jgi:hypothetical protein